MKAVAAAVVVTVIAAAGWWGWNTAVTYGQDLCAITASKEKDRIVEEHAQSMERFRKQAAQELTRELDRRLDVERAYANIEAQLVKAEEAPSEYTSGECSITDSDFDAINRLFDTTAGDSGRGEEVPSN